MLLMLCVRIVVGERLMMKIIRHYTEIKNITSFEQRYDYLKLDDNFVKLSNFYKMPIDAIIKELQCRLFISRSNMSDKHIKRIKIDFLDTNSNIHVFLIKTF